jgi:vacuolar-type H+-ATPase subunit I/STV1
MSVDATLADSLAGSIPTTLVRKMNIFRSKQMRQINLFVDEEDIEELTIALTRMDALQLIEERQNRSGGTWSSLARRYGALERRLDDLLDALEIPRKEAPPPKDLHPSQDIDPMQDTVQKAEQSVHDLQERENAAEHAFERANLLVEEMQLLEPMDIPVERLRELEHLHLTVGTIPTEELASLRASLFHISFAIIPALEYDGRVLIFAASTREHSAILDRALASAYFDQLQLPQEASGYPDQVMDELQSRLANAEDHLNAVKQEHQQTVEEWGEQLLSMWRRARADVQVANTISGFGREGDMYLVRGQVPESALDKVVERAKAITGD